MADLEKVIRGLECQYEPRMTCYGCDYFIARDKLCNKNKIFREAVELLRAQEPIKPKINIDTWVCGNCGTRLERQSMIGPNAVLAETFKFCPECGKAVKWYE